MSAPQMSAFTLTRSTQQSPERERGAGWWEEAACLGLATREYDAWYVDRGGSDGYGDARRICAGCPVATECLADAMADEAGSGHTGRFGIRAGLTPEERHELARTGSTPAPTPAVRDREARYDQIRSLRADGLTVRAIVARMHVSEGMVHRVMRSAR